MDNYKIIILSMFLLTSFITCKDSAGEYDNSVAAVNSIIEPIDGKDITLQPSESATVYFEWEHVKMTNSGPVIYQVAFDKEGGNFSSPIYLAFSNNNGFDNSLTLSHKQLNKIAGMAGFGPSEKASLKWTVIASKGLNALKAGVENSIYITRLAGFPEEEIPIDIYITGEGSEGGTDISKSMKMKAISSGEFEIYTKIEKGKPFYFVSNKTNNSNRFSISNNLVIKGGNSSLSNDGVYKITMDFNTGASTVTLIEGIGFFFSPFNALIFELPYVGNGIFRAENTTVTFKQESWGRDERYKFRMFIRENSGSSSTKELEWATLNQTDSRPTPTSPESYYYMRLTDNITRWDNKWKLMGDFDGVPANYTIFLQADKPYTHSISK